MNVEKPDAKTATLVQNYLRKFIYEHPDTVFMAYMGYHNQWRTWLWNNAPSDLLKLYDEYVHSIDQAKEREINRRALSPTGQGLYSRPKWPRLRLLPAYNWPKARLITRKVFVQLKKLRYIEALDFISEMIVAWFYSCPEVLLKLNSAYPIKFPEQATDLDYVNVLWDLYYEYITDFRHGIHTREDFEQQIERVRLRKRSLRWRLGLR